jgi:beta-lactamase regulating signal transducer with metallopeptidase domain/peptidoglycan hydrolase CwlO-like protein
MMDSGSFMHFASGFLAMLGASALRSIVLAGVAGVLLAIFCVKDVTLRLAVWKLALWSALAMPLLALVLPPVQFAVPVAVSSQFERFGFGGTAALRTSSPQRVVADGAVDANDSLRAAHPEFAEAAAGRSRVATHHGNAIAAGFAGFSSADGSNLKSAGSVERLRWNETCALIALAVYLAMAGLLLSRLFIGWVFGRRLIRGTVAIRDPRASLSLSLRAFPGRLRETPLLAESAAVLVPVTLGVMRPVILLPGDWREWGSDKLNAVLAHELSHIGRGDALMQRLAKLHRAIFWFSPLAWWLDRELGRLAEEASDEAALAGGADRERYAEILLRFFEAIRAGSGRVWWQGVSMAAGGDAARRVDRILGWKGAVTMRLRKSFVVLLVGAALALLFAASSVHFTAAAAAQKPLPRGIAPLPGAPPPAPAGAMSATSPSASALPAPSVQGAPPAYAPDSTPPTPLMPSMPDVAGLAPLAEAPPVAPVAGIAPSASQSQSGNTSTWVMGDEHVRDPFIIAAGNSYIAVLNHSVMISESGDTEELAQAKALHAKIGGDFIWFKHEGKGYVIRDRATIDRALELYKPMHDLDAQQEELGKQQEELGKQQDALGDQMEEVKVKIPDMTADLERIKERMREIAEKGGTPSEIGDLQSELGELQSRIGEIQSEAGSAQSKIGRQQGELGRKQGELGRREGEIGRKQGELSRKAVQQTQGILDDARTKGLAQPE